MDPVGPLKYRTRGGGHVTTPRRVTPGAARSTASRADGYDAAADAFRRSAGRHGCGGMAAGPPAITDPDDDRQYPRSVTFERITVDPAVMSGMPTIRGLRIPVATVVTMVADGMTAAEIVDDLPDLVVEDVAEALRYAAEAVRERELPLRPSA
jgi:uncharacterized protein (DUF433 family)